MSKKFTSFLVLAAALLLTVPTHAQLVKKAAKQKVTALKAGPVKAIDVQKAKAAKAKANDKTVGFAFTGAKHQQVAVEATLLKAAINNIESDKAAFEKQMEANLNAIASGSREMTPVNYATVDQLLKRLAKGAAMPLTARAQVKSAASAPSDPTKASVTLTAGDVWGDGSGYQLLLDADATAYGTIIPESGPLTSSGDASAETYAAFEYKIPENADGALTTSNIVVNNSITIEIPAGTYDWVVTNPTAGDRMWIAGNGRGDDYVFEAGKTYELVVELKGSSDNVTVMVDGVAPAGPEVVVLPEGVEAVSYTMNYFDSENAAQSKDVKVAVDGNDVYFQGMSKYIPEAWVKGTKEGNTVTFAAMQFMGEYGQYGESYFFYTGPATFTFDAETESYSLEGQVFGVLGGQYYDGRYFNPVLAKGAAEEPVATTGANVDAVPYSNALNTADLFADFGVIDSNKDGKTWAYSDSYGAYYTYSSANAANDWLISPAIKLEAGKKYHFAVDAAAASATYSERFEVLIGTEAKASALTQSVLSATEVASKEFATYENEIVEVAETGYYHFGIHAISDADKYMLMLKNFLVEAGAEATAPAAVTDFAVAQTPNKLEAVVSFKAPTKTVAGEDLTDLTNIDVLRDGAVVKSLVNVEESSVAWTASDQDYENAQDVAAIDFGGGFTATLADGGNSNNPKYYTSGTALRMYAKNSMTLKGTAIKKVVFTFKDKNVLEANVGTLAIDGMTGTWTGNADEIVFTVTDGSGNQARIQKIEIEAGLTLTPGAEYNYVDAEGLTVGNHVYQVIPYNASGAGIKSEEKSIFITASLEAPYTFDFSTNLLDLFTVIDNNNDGKTWSWNASSGVANYSYSSDNDGDDYLVTLPFNLKAGKRYNVIVNAKGSESYPERFEVKAGKEATVAGLTEQVIAPTDLNTGEFDDYEGVFAPEEDGLYFFAIHAISDADMLNLQVKTLTIELAPELTAPAAVADLTATAGAEGALEANLAFTAPTKDINGDALTSGALNVKIYRDGELVNTLENVLVGAAATWKDTNVENGKIYTYYVVANNESGDGMKSEKVKVFVGFDAPTAVENFTATDNGTSVSLTWQKVGSVGVNGGYVNTANVNYEVWSLKIVETMFGYSLDYDELLATVTDGDSYTATLNADEGDQDYKYWAVKPVNEIGEGAASVASLLVGAPYALPFVDSFTEGTSNIYESDGSLYLSEESSDEDGYSLMLTAEEEPGVFTVNTGKIGIKNAANPTLIFHVKGVGVNKMDVVASVDGGAFQTLSADVTVTDEFTVVKVPLTSIKNSRYVKLGFKAAIQNLTVVDIDWNTYQYIYDFGDQLLIDELRVVDLYEYNLVADIKAPNSVVAGKSAKVLATVRNEGENAATNYTVTIKANDKLLASVLADENLESFASDEISVDFETSIFDEAGDVTLTVSVEYENELLPEDNTASTIITVQEPAAVAPTSLLAEDKGKAGVDLTWTVAAAGTEEVVENFTSYENGANEALGDWTLINNNGATKGAIFQDLQLANDGLAKAWEVMKPSEYGISNTLFNGPNGSLEEAYLISAYNLEGQSYPDNDDWLISPELPGIAQEISFAIGALDVQYGPSSYEVLVSSTDSEIASFTKVAEGTLTSAGWNSVTAQLPAGTKYFAIRNNTSGDGAMCVMLGDIKFTANSSATATSFNIYLDKEQFANVEGDKTTYTAPANKLSAGEHTFAVTAVYANGAESKPVTATVTVTTDIRQIAADGKAVDVYSLDGKLIRSQATSLDGLKGFYIVNGKKVMVK